MTEKLYLKDSYLNVCEAKVLDIVEENDAYSVICDKTPFFPGGGGQPSDKGSINELYVVEAFEKDGVVYHKLKDKNCSFDIGETVTLSVFNEIRFERMRAHTGEHIISGIAHKNFCVENVGFHMDDNGLMTVDFNKYLDSNDLQVLEYEANRCVMSNLKVTSDIYSINEAENIKYRSKLDFSDDVRIVDIEGVDKCACCAPHLKSTGEVGFIKILTSASHRGGVRITLICGTNAYWEFEKRYRQIVKISSLLCAKHDEADTAVSNLIESNKNLKYETEQMKYKYLEYISLKIEPSDIIIEFFESFAVDELRIINNNLKTKCSIASFLFSGNDSDGYNYCIYSEKLQLNCFIREFNSSLNGSGGGRGIVVQGKVKALSSDIIRFINEMKVDNYENA